MILNDSLLTESMGDSNNVVSLKVNEEFYNAKDTTGDAIYINGKQYDGSFIDYWYEKTKTSEDEGVECMNFLCQSSGKKRKEVVGAHIVLNKEAVDLKKGNVFYIVTLCSKCNHYTNTAMMKLDHSIKAPVLIWTGEIGSYNTK